MPPMPCDMAAGTAWDTVPIWEQKWPATLLIPFFTHGMPAVELCDGSSYRRRMFSFVLEVRVPGFTGGYVADTSAAYEN